MWKGTVCKRCVFPGALYWMGEYADVVLECLRQSADVDNQPFGWMHLLLTRLYSSSTILGSTVDNASSTLLVSQG